jgi:phage RecT family recombinase
MSGNSTAVALSPRQKLKSELAKFEPSLQSMLPKGYEASRLITGAMMAAQQNPDLMKCTPVSIATALGRIAQWNLDVGLTAHLVPFGSACTAVADYKGLIALMVRAGARKVEAYVVREGDAFEYQLGTEAFLRHIPKTSTTPILGAYCIVTLRGSVTQFEYMSADDIEKLRQQYSKANKKGPLTEWYARKTVIRRCAKYVPQNEQLARALAEDEAPIEVDEDGVVLTSQELDTKYEPTRASREAVVDVEDAYAAEGGEVDI